ncbi:dihydrofolate reductase-like domain-containing protein [Hysterangium stoloniferum]|nr:dihydrofolate reductase-like domain-containing protein [Hysterangium stoloniferum]
MIPLTIIVAATRANGIGQGPHLPWRLPLEMAYFARITKHAPADHKNAVLMGRITWECIPKSKRPLADRVNIVVSSNPEYTLGSAQGSLPVFLDTSLDAAITRISENSESINANVYRRFIIGGASIYKETLELEPKTPTSPVVNRILLTRVLSPAFEDCDVFFPEFQSQGWNRASHAELEAWAGFRVAEGVQSEKGVEYEFQMWVRAV